MVSPPMLVDLAKDLFREKIRLLLVWAGAFVVWIVLVGLLWKTLAGSPDVNSLASRLAHLAGSMSSPDQDYLLVMFYATILPLGMVVFGAQVGSRLLTGQKARSELSLLLALPLPRWKILIGRLLYLAAALLGVTVVILISTLVMVWASELQINGLALVAIGFRAYLLGLLFALLTVLVANFIKKPDIAQILTLIVFVLAYLLYLLPINSTASPVVGYLSPMFYYLGYAPLLEPWVTGHFLILMGVNIVAMVAVWRQFDAVDLD